MIDYVSISFDIGVIFVFTLVIELITVLLRIKFGSKKKLYKKYKFKSKWRMHHGYIGLIFVALFLPYYHRLFVDFGMALVLSDLAHHFIVLPLWIGKREL